MALGLVAVLVAITAAAAFILTGSGSPSKVAGWAPAGSVAYVELRLDLPGSQQRQLGQFLSHFPGFDDQAALETKLGEVMDRLLREASDGEVDWTSDVDPWFGGQLGFALTRFPETPAMPDLDAPPEEWEFPEPQAEPFVAIATVDDEALAEAFLADVAADAGTPTTTETHAGLTLTVAEAPGGAAAWTITDGVLLVGELESVKAAIDTGGSGLTEDADYRAARTELDGDQLAFYFMDIAAYTDEMSGLFEDLGDLAPIDPSASFDALGPWVAGALRADGDALIAESVMPEGARPSPVAPSASQLDARFPADSIVAIEVRDLGAVIDDMFEQYREQGLGEMIDELDGALALVGGREAAISWIGDAGIVFTPDGGALLTVPDDAADAERLLTTLKGFLAFGGDMGIELREESYAGETIVVFDAGDLGPEMGIDPGDASLAVVVTDDLVVFGVGTTVVKSILDTAGGDSLADDPTYSALADRAGRTATGSAYVDLDALRAFVEEMLADSGEDVAEYEREARPYLEPFEAMYMNATVADGLVRTTFIITVE